MKPPFFQRIKRAIRLEFRRIRDEHRRTGRRRKKIPFSIRFRRWVKKVKGFRFDIGRKRRSKPQLPPLSKRLGYYFQNQREKYAVVFSSKYLIITLNSTFLYLLSFFLIHFLTHLVTGITAWFFEISTTLNYTFVDFHIRYYNWTDEMVIMVFSIPAIFALIISLLTSIPFARDLKRPRFFRRLPYLTKKQRYRHKRKQRTRDLELQVQRLSNLGEPGQAPKRKKRLSWQVRLFFLWTFFHSTTYLLSGMLYAFLFHRRIGYVIWYAFNTYFFDLLFSAIAFLSLILLGYFFAAQFFNSGRMYLNDLNDRNRMPFALSQAIFPFIIGTIITIALQIPVFDPALILLNFSIFFMLLPIPSRAAHFDTLHFDSREKTAKINWKWIAVSSVIILAILIAIKIGITIRLP